LGVVSEGESRQPLKFTRPPAGRRAETPLWAKWALSIGVVVVLLVALIIYVDHHNTDDSNGQPLTAKALEEQNQEATILQQQDQTPVVFKLAAGAVAVHAAEHAVHIDMSQRINHNEAGPPLKAASCHATTTAGARHGFSCKVLSGGVYFDFVAVIDAPARQLILCKRDPPPIPSETVPLDARCRP
jgi:hypothetical protein